MEEAAAIVLTTIRIITLVITGRIPPPESNSQPVVLDDEVLDSDGDKLPDILDFNDIEQKYYSENDASKDMKISSIPSRHYLGNFKDAVSFTADLTAGTEYTIEFSESAGIAGVNEAADYAYPIEDSIPDVEIINPEGKTLQFLDFGTYDANYDAGKVIALSDDVIELSVYPDDNPYMICYTFTPSVTGSYTINLSRIDLDKTASDDAAADEDDFDHITTLFIYKELRDGTERNEAGYYKRYVFKDADGNMTGTISMSDIMALRKAYNDLVYDVLSAAWELDGADSDDITEDDWEEIIGKADTDAQEKSYLECFARLQEYYGIFISEDKQVNTKDIVNGLVSGDEYDEVGELNNVSQNAQGAGQVSASANGKLTLEARTLSRSYTEYLIPMTSSPE